MSYDDPEYLDDPCTCGNRALRPEEAVVYDIPRAEGVVRMIFARDCPVHGCFWEKEETGEDGND